MAPRLILASNSPRRRQLLSLTGWPFTVRPVDVDESPLPGERPAAYVLRLAESKARAAALFAEPGQLVLAADTTVAVEDAGIESILGKPADADEAWGMLSGLRGREHRVYTAIGVAEPQSGRLETGLCATQVWMRQYRDDEIRAYIASGDPFDKAGGYAIQHPVFRPVERIDGCYACVVGLPVCHVVRVLRGFGLDPAGNVAAACPEELQMDTPCPEIEKLLHEAQDGKPVNWGQD